MNRGRLWIMHATATTCPIARAAELLGDHCSLLIVRDLLGGPKRFCELERSLEGVSTRTLTLKLKNLEHQGLLERRELTDPVRVEYRLTHKGKALKKVVDTVREYGARYLC